MDEQLRPYSAVNRTRFLNICYEHNRMDSDTKGIGTLKEKRLHKVLKDYFDSSDEHQEIPYLGYVADIKNDDGVIEIQTGELNPLFPKLNAFLPQSTVYLVHPLVKEKTLAWIDPETGKISPRRKSPQHETFFDGFLKLYNIRSHLSSPNLKIRFVSIETDEYRYRDGYARNGKKGSHRYERIPIQLFDIFSIDSPADYSVFLPQQLRGEEPFTTGDYGRIMGTGSKASYYALTVMTCAGLLRKEGKRGRSQLYKMNSVL